MVEKQVMHEYPYGIGTFIKNSREYGFKKALKEDWCMTKDLTKDNISHTLEKVVVGGFMVLFTPILLVQTARSIYKTEKRIKLREKK